VITAVGARAVDEISKLFGEEIPEIIKAELLAKAKTVRKTTLEEISHQAMSPLQKSYCPMELYFFKKEPQEREAPRLSLLQNLPGGYLNRVSTRILND
jgi:hypothetical protein